MENKYRIIATDRASKKRVPITGLLSEEQANAFKPSRFHKEYYKYFKKAKNKINQTQTEV